MAAAIVPLVLGMAPTLINLITSLVHKSAPTAQQLGPGTGPVKFANVFSDVMGSLTRAAEAGQISKTLPSDDIVKVIIQSVVASMKLCGLLGDIPEGTLPATTTDSQSISLTSGQSLTVTVK